MPWRFSSPILRKLFQIFRAEQSIHANVNRLPTPAPAVKSATWETLLADRSLRDLPYKIETNRFDKIIMSPASNWHSDYQAEIAYQLRLLMPDGRVSVEFALETADGVRVPDVTWISKARRAPYGRTITFPIAPEICIEILSSSNRREELLEKMTLYFAKGAQEVWLCDENGNMEFFSALSAPQSIPSSRLCKDFPRQIVLA
jgi:Uma2 family endonuclease